MITLVEARNPQGDVLAFQIANPTNGYEVRDIDGLDPVEATIVSSSFANQDGEQFQTSRRAKRNIVLKLGYDPDYVTTTVRQLRKALYNFFMPKSDVSFRFYSDDMPAVDIQGKIESMVSPLFTEDPQATISALCLLPDFYSPIPVDVAGVTVADTTEQAITYAGNVETGLLFTLNVNRSISDVIIYHRTPDNSIHTLEFAYALVAGDILKISTVPGNKYAILTRGGIDASVLYGVSPTSSWIELVPGVNNIRVAVTGAGIPFVLEYTDKYGGL